MKISSNVRRHEIFGEMRSTPREPLILPLDAININVSIAVLSQVECMRQINSVNLVIYK